MDVTPKVINEVEFHQKMRGYDPDEVDDFLERVAVAVGQLQERITDASERAAAAERRASELEQRQRESGTKSEASSEDDAETMKRTLVLAQKTADAAVQEAQEEAKQIVDSARDQARQLALQIESDARQEADDTRQKLVAEVGALEEARDAIKADHGILERHLDEQRLRLRSSIDELQRLLDDPARLRVAPPPELSGVDRPAFAAAPVAEAESPAAAPEPGPAVEQATLASVFADLDDPADARSANDADIIDLDRPTTGGVTFTEPADDPVGSELDLGLGESLGDDEEDAWSRFMDDGPSTQALNMDDAGDDAYLAELRKAMLDDTSAAPMPDSQRAKTRFGRRR